MGNHDKFLFQITTTVQYFKNNKKAPKHLIPKSFYHFHRKSPRIKVPPPTHDLNFHIKKISMFWEIFSRKQRVGTNRSRKSRHIPRWFVRVWNIKCETSVSIHRNLKEQIMKFAEHLTAHITPEWRKQYINYEVRFQIFSNNCTIMLKNDSKLWKILVLCVKWKWMWKFLYGYRY